MYNYQNRSLDYYNYNNNNYNQPLYKKDANPASLYDPYQGFIRGNMFPNLYNGYKLSQPLDLNPKTEKEQLLYYLDAITFAMIDINLYLDNYPDDKDMIILFNQYRIEADKLCQEYEKKYGPLMTDSSATNNYPWIWDNKPWPWEKK